MKAPRANPRWVGVFYFALAGVVLAPFLLLLLAGAYHVLTRPDLVGISEWLREQNLPAGEYTDVELPARFALAAHGGTVDVVVAPTGRIAFLLKTSVGWKQNYEGYVYATSPLGSGEFFDDYYGRACIKFTEYEHPVVECRIDDQTYEVFFDLG